MKFKVKKTKEAQKNFNELTEEQKCLLKSDYEKIETKGIETVFIRTIDKGIFEIKTKDLRSIFKYKEGQIILIGVIYIKNSQKMPKNILKKCKKILKGD
ncbi:MAG: type II toxin-antitoxin system RelE/ParE family toxin [bacterium]